MGAASHLQSEHHADTMCFKTWNDLIISLPNKTVNWCCKTELTEDQRAEVTFDLDILEAKGLDFLLNHPTLQKRKYELSNGIQSADCSGCWKSEEASGTSTRTEHIRKNNPLFNKKLDLSSDLFQFVELELTNKCNMACAYCWEGQSSRWQKETGRRFPDTEDAIFEKVLQLLNEWWNSTLKHKDFITFSLLGGEPFFTNHMYQFIEEFIVNINDTITDGQEVVLVVTTNLNFPKHKYDKFIELVKRTPNIRYEMQLSGEALGKRSELIRWGLDFDKWNQNVDSFFKQSKETKNLILGFGCAHNSLSLPYFKDFLIYLNEKINKFDYDKEIIMHHNRVQDPLWLSVLGLDPSHTNTIQEQIDYFIDMSGTFDDKQGYISVLRDMKSMVSGKVSTEAKQLAKKQFEILEKRRKISFSDHFPHYHELIE